MASFSEVTQQDIDALKNSDDQLVVQLLEEFREKFPSVVQTIVTERDQYMAARLRLCPGKKIVAVVGKGHVNGWIDIGYIGRMGALVDSATTAYKNTKDQSKDLKTLSELDCWDKEEWRLSFVKSVHDTIIRQRLDYNDHDSIVEMRLWSRRYDPVGGVCSLPLYWITDPAVVVELGEEIQHLMEKLKMNLGPSVRSNLQSVVDLCHYSIHPKLEPLFQGILLEIVQTKILRMTLTYNAQEATTETMYIDRFKIDQMDLNTHYLIVKPLSQEGHVKLLKSMVLGNDSLNYNAYMSFLDVFCSAIDPSIPRELVEHLVNNKAIPKHVSLVDIITRIITPHLDTLRTSRRSFSIDRPFGKELCDSAKRHIPMAFHHGIIDLPFASIAFKTDDLDLFKLLCPTTFRGHDENILEFLLGMSCLCGSRQIAHYLMSQLDHYMLDHSPLFWLVIGQHLDLARELVLNCPSVSKRSEIFNKSPGIVGEAIFCTKQYEFLSECLDAGLRFSIPAKPLPHGHDCDLVCVALKGGDHKLMAMLRKHSRGHEACPMSIVDVLDQRGTESFAIVEDYFSYSGCDQVFIGSTGVPWAAFARSTECLEFLLSRPQGHRAITTPFSLKAWYNLFPIDKKVENRGIVPNSIYRLYAHFISTHQTDLSTYLAKSPRFTSSIPLEDLMISPQILTSVGISIKDHPAYKLQIKESKRREALEDELLALEEKSNAKKNQSKNKKKNKTKIKPPTTPAQPTTTNDKVSAITTTISTPSSPTSTNQSTTPTYKVPNTNKSQLQLHLSTAATPSSCEEVPALPTYNTATTPTL
eukprot:gene14492-17102_t